MLRCEIVPPTNLHDILLPYGAVVPNGAKSSPTSREFPRLKSWAETPKIVKIQKFGKNLASSHRGGTSLSLTVRIEIIGNWRCSQFERDWDQLRASGWVFTLKRDKLAKNGNLEGPMLTSGVRRETGETAARTQSPVPGSTYAIHSPW